MINSSTQIASEAMIHSIEWDVPEHYHEQILQICARFANRMCSRGQSAFYYKSQRNARDPEYDIAVGKYGEMAAAYLMAKHFGFPVVMPDFEVRKGRGKGWECDLPYANHSLCFPNCHVKTCDKKSRDYVRKNSGDEYSWTFQYANKSTSGGTDSLFSEQETDDIVLFLYLEDLESRKVELVASAPWSIVRANLKDPISYRLKGLKKCAYYRDLVKLSFPN